MNNTRIFTEMIQSAQQLQRAATEWYDEMNEDFGPDLERGEDMIITNRDIELFAAVKRMKELSQELKNDSHESSLSDSSPATEGEGASYEEGPLTVSGEADSKTSAPSPTIEVGDYVTVLEGCFQGQTLKVVEVRHGNSAYALDMGEHAPPLFFHDHEVEFSSRPGGRYQLNDEGTAIYDTHTSIAVARNPKGTKSAIEAGQRICDEMNRR